MTAFIVSTCIGVLLGFSGKAISWALGSLAIVMTIIVALCISGPSFDLLIVALISILGYNFGLITTFSSMLPKRNVVLRS